jgi:hypothetical protein
MQRRVISPKATRLPARSPDPVHTRKHTRHERRKSGIRGRQERAATTVGDQAALRDGNGEHQRLTVRIVDGQRRAGKLCARNAVRVQRPELARFLQAA